MSPELLTPDQKKSIAIEVESQLDSSLNVRAVYPDGSVLVRRLSKEQELHLHSVVNAVDELKDPETLYLLFLKKLKKHLSRRKSKKSIIFLQKVWNEVAIGLLKRSYEKTGIEDSEVWEVIRAGAESVRGSLLTLDRPSSLGPSAFKHKVDSEVHVKSCPDVELIRHCSESRLARIWLETAVSVVRMYEQEKPMNLA